MKVALPIDTNVYLKKIILDLKSRNNAGVKESEKGESAPAPAKNGVYVSTGIIGEKYSNRTKAENIELLRATLLEMEANAKKVGKSTHRILKFFNLITKQEDEMVVIDRNTIDIQI
ncbi:MAG: hypothetical protein ACOX4M_07540 [Acetivibrionales bacterium]|jgi:hypothetical protein